MCPIRLTDLMAVGLDHEGLNQTQLQNRRNDPLIFNPLFNLWRQHTRRQDFRPRYHDYLLLERDLDRLLHRLGLRWSNSLGERARDRLQSFSAKQGEKMIVR